MPFSFLLKPLAGPIASGVSVLLLAALIYVGLGSIEKSHTIKSLDNEIYNPKTGYVVRLQQSSADLAQCHANEQTLQGTIGRQNAAIAADKAADQQRAAELDRIAADYRTKLAAADARARDILNRKSTGNVCADADALILESVR